MTDSTKPSALRPQFGSFALAFAIIFAAGVYGFVSSAAFAIFFMSFIGFLLFLGIGLFFATTSDGGWLSAIVAGIFILVAIAALVGGIQDARQKIMQPTTSTAAH